MLGEEGDVKLYKYIKRFLWRNNGIYVNIQWNVKEKREP